ncbi:MAG: UDP-N-acetylmuramate:L-alanyl-gamma-D-glutamyl-meso-diaminopimelate ligase [Bacteroidota bacterium]|nr:UDP-N-acetylmuramate:L-alanyl-gamma-D-glutamyl-meso-diaminopimelate ligase [Bacteroidota bacterium]MDP4230913.1 UDP-N-acetylmuramate:L-alanyl-gamma-D-glutamyl-meso-diaminopimelate ligase [Bacteroidota bacterium]MDP4235985.1 UDP-N-acetylmuramate:L-alanyl-gamma-D-glutamyl-meso-diaminopimelate ligase [Bacteroidota bacterium]
MRIYFIGICGTAMGNGALLFREMGYEVSGSDENIYPPMSDLLRSSGIVIYSGYDSAHIQDAKPDLVVVGNAISRGNTEVEFLLNEKIKFISLAELFENYLIQGKESIVISGTHGKTTTSALAAWTFESAGLQPNFLVGGILENFGKGYQAYPKSPYVILEGDEYDTAFFDKRSKFLHYLPTTLIINNIEFDHADIFANLDEIKLSFRRLVNIVPQKGIVIANGDDRNVGDVIANSIAPVTTFGTSANCSWRASNITYHENSSEFDIIHEGKKEARVEVNLLGEFNVKNALAVAIAARHYDIPYDAIQKAFASFKNVKRRLEFKGEFGGVKVYDDFAHHPTAIRETMKAFRTKFPNDRIIAIFEPRSNTTRRNIFQKELAECFADADIVFMSQIARLHLLSESERLDPEKVMSDIRAQGKQAFYLPDPDAISTEAATIARSGDAIIVMSNGGFGGIHGMLAKKLAAKK